MLTSSIPITDKSLTQGVAADIGLRLKFTQRNLVRLGYVTRCGRVPAAPPKHSAGLRAQAVGSSNSSPTTNLTADVWATWKSTEEESNKGRETGLCGACERRIRAHESVGNTRAQWGTDGAVREAGSPIWGNLSSWENPLPRFPSWVFLSAKRHWALAHGNPDSAGLCPAGLQYPGARRAGGCGGYVWAGGGGDAPCRFAWNGTRRSNSAQGPALGSVRCTPMHPPRQSRREVPRAAASLSAEPWSASGS